MTIKRIILSVLTIVAVIRVILSLGESFDRPQVQSRLQLYQTNLMLQAAELGKDRNDSQLQISRDALIGADPYPTAQKQYAEARSAARTTLSQLELQMQQLSSGNSSLESDNPASARNLLEQKQLQQGIVEIEKFIDELDLKIGIIEARQQKIDTALKTWQDLIERNQQQDFSKEIAETAKVAIDLWSESPRSFDGESTIVNNLEGWFRNSLLARLYEVRDRQKDLLALQAKEENLAKQAILKLVAIGGVPIIGGILGIIILTFLGIQWLIQKDRSLIAINSNNAWEVPWSGEIVWQVLIVGFFFVGQILLPLLIGLSGINPIGWSLRQKALYILISYLLLALGGLAVMYFSIKPFFPLPKNWFRFRLLDSWFWWGVGGYLVALPLVVFVSLINQELWDGQGGSNPLLFLALQARDKVALAIFFFTASIAAPAFEETIFRGFLLSSLTRYLPVWGSIFVSSSIFSVAHLSLSEILPLTTLGIVLGVVYTRSRNLLASILLHSLWNSGTLFSLFVLGSGGG